MANRYDKRQPAALDSVIRKPELFPAALPAPRRKRGMASRRTVTTIRKDANAYIVGLGATSEGDVVKPTDNVVSELAQSLVNKAFEMFQTHAKSEPGWFTVQSVTAQLADSAVRGKLLHVRLMLKNRIEYTDEDGRKIIDMLEEMRSRLRDVGVGRGLRVNVFPMLGFRTPPGDE